MKTLLEELVELVKKYGYDPENGGMEPKLSDTRICANCGNSETGLPHGETMEHMSFCETENCATNCEYNECSLCSRELAEE